jgi:peptidoglycan/xylan/chitin deacetylase (PgdA/CDA1 family)
MRKKLKEAMGRMAGMAGMYGRRSRSTMTIVAFHRVNDLIPPDGLTCSARKFEAFCEFFRKYFQIVPLSRQVADCRAGRDTGGTLSITFDDGYADNFEVAAPILRKLGIPATFFVVSGFIGTDTVAPWDRDLSPQLRWMSWEQVRALAAQGFEIGGHTHTHIDIGTADLERVRTELVVSKRMLEEELGVPVTSFAYPFGGREDISERARDLVRQCGFDCCLSCFGGLNAVATDPYHLKRVPIAEWFATPHQFGFEMLMHGRPIPPEHRVGLGQ